jgi:hypothetical protein
MGNANNNFRQPVGSGSATGNPGSAVGFSGTGSESHQTKPPVTPVSGIERAATTSYDEDLYETKASDTWDSISQEFYNNKNYGTALRTYNKQNSAGPSGTINIPPLYILKQKNQAPGKPITTISNSSPPASPPPPAWAPSTTTTPATSTGDGKMYRVPPGGISMKAIARNFLGNDQRWTEIYNLNPHLKPDSIPEGTDVRLPTDARLPN